MSFYIYRLYGVEVLHPFLRIGKQPWVSVFSTDLSEGTQNSRVNQVVDGKMVVDKMVVDKMVVDKMVVDKMVVEKKVF